jgi:hypothetical protein
VLGNAVSCSGCQKNVPVFKRFFLQPLMPNFRISEHYYGKRYKGHTLSVLFVQAKFFLSASKSKCVLGKNEGVGKRGKEVGAELYSVLFLGFNIFQFV